jgi:hypothetical protein
LDQTGEWCFDGSKVYLYYASDPSSLTIKAGIYEDGITISGSHIIIDGLNINNYYRDGIRVQTASHGNQFKNSTITNCVCAINLLNTDTYLIDANTIEDIGNFGLYISACDTGVITSNTIEDIGIIAGFGDIGLTAIALMGCDTTEIYYNDIDSIGYNGIDATICNRTYIEKNRVRNYCYLTTDGGGIYSYWNDTIHVSNYSGTTWRKNFVDGGTDHTAAVAGLPVNYAGIMGLYSDGGSSYHIIDSNLVVNNKINIFLNSPSNTTITNNWTTKSYVWVTTWGAEICFVKASTLDSAYNIDVYDNRFITNWQTGWADNTWPAAYQGYKYRSMISNFDSNYYCNPTGSYYLYVIYNIVNTNIPISTVYDLASWKALKGGDEESGDAMLWTSEYTNTTRSDFVTFDYNFSNTPRKYAFENGWTYYDIYGNRLEGTYELDAYEGVVLFRINNADDPNPFIPVFMKHGSKFLKYGNKFLRN